MMIINVNNDLPFYQLSYIIQWLTECDFLFPSLHSFMIIIVIIILADKCIKKEEDS